MAYREYPGKGGEDKQGWARGQTSPGLASTKTGQYTVSPGNPKSGNPFGRKDTPDPSGSPDTFPKSGQKGARPGTSETNAGPSVSVDMNLRVMPKAQ